MSAKQIELDIVKVMKAIDESWSTPEGKKKKEMGCRWMKNYFQDVSVDFVASVCSGDTGHKIWS